MFLFLPLTCVWLPGWRSCRAGPVRRLDAAADLRVRRMRTLLIEHVFRADLMLEALALNAVFMAAAVVAYLRLFDSARQQGSLATGE